MKLSAPAAGLFLGVIIFASYSPTVQANEVNKTDTVKNVLNVALVENLDPINQPLLKSEEPEPPKPKEPKQHIVAEGETLSKIAELHTITWQRIYAKNLDIENPDTIRGGDKIIIPFPEEVLPERALPIIPQPVNQAPSTASSATARGRATTPASPPAYRGSSSGNGYGYGYCTFYAKNRRPDLPNNLGNADTWTARAAAQGIATGSVPRTGAIGQRGMHVVYVEAVNADGTVTVSEMNFAGFNVISSRTVGAGTFQYIY